MLALVAFTSPAEAQTAGRFTPIAIGADGLVVISYYDASNGEMKLESTGSRR